MGIEAVVFDLDGLMIDSERLVQKTWNIAGIAMGYGELGEHIYHTLGFNVQKRKAYFQKVYGEDFPFDEFRARTREAWNKAISKQHVPAKKGLYHLLDTLKPVSYTHLDVYKRQGVGNSDPDVCSKTLQKYHQILWSKPLPNGEYMDLKIGSGNRYLTWKEFRFGSDSITASFRYKDYKLIKEIEKTIPDYHSFMEE